MFTATVVLNAMYPVVDETSATQTIIVENVPTKDLDYLIDFTNRLEDLDVASPFYIKSVSYEEK